MCLPEMMGTWHPSITQFGFDGLISERVPRGQGLLGDKFYISYRSEIQVC